MEKALIELSGMRFKAYHGCLETEKKNGGEFVVDFSCRTDIGPAAASDDLSRTTDYSVICGIVADVMKNPANLIETVAVRIADAISAAFPELEEFSVKVSKLNPPVGIPADKASVTVCRKR